MSANSYSLHIGINGVDTGHYQGWDGKLYGCENDAIFYYQLAQKEGCKQSRILLTSDSANLPDSENVLNFLERSSEELEPGDRLFITYSGHGGFIEDKNFDERDFQDETWCLYDRQLLDDELYYRFSRFREGVNIILISDSCHSGSISKGEDERSAPADRIIRLAPRKSLFKTYVANRSVYEPLMRRKLTRKSEIPAAVLQLGACQDNEYAVEDGTNGLFTKTIMNILARNAGVSSYYELLMRTKRALTGIQKPNLVTFGKDYESLLTIKPIGAAICEEEQLNRFRYADQSAFAVCLLEDDPKLSLLEAYQLRARYAGEQTGLPLWYHCCSAMEEPGMYRWDHAYRQYWLLKEKGYPVQSVMPADEEGSFEFVLQTREEQAALCDVVNDLLFARSAIKRGVGRESVVSKDAGFFQMMCHEVLHVIKTDPDLSAFAVSDPEKFRDLLKDKPSLADFISLLKQSVYSSDTLTIHL